MTNGSLMKVESIAECSIHKISLSGSMSTEIWQYFCDISWNNEKDWLFEFTSVFAFYK